MIKSINELKRKKQEAMKKAINYNEAILKNMESLKSTIDIK